MATEHDVLGLIDLIYAAAYEPERWRDYALALRDAAEADSVSLILHSLREQNSAILTELTTTAGAQAAYGAHYYKTDRWRMASHGVARDAIWLSHEQIDDNDFAESEFYRDFLCGNGTPLFYFGGGAIESGAQTEIVCGILRERPRGPFGEDHRRLMEALKPHMARAIQIDRRLRHLRAERDVASAAAEGTGFGVVLLDARGGILSANGAAAEILASGDGLAGGGRLAALRGGDDARLQAVIRAAIAGQGGSMALERSSGRRAYWLLLAPVPGGGGRDLTGGENPAAMAFITDPERRPVIAREALQDQYGLTPQEARVAIGLAEGSSLGATAARLGIAPATAETHLKRAMRKLRVHNRGALLTLLLRSSGPVIAGR